MSIEDKAVFPVATSNLLIAGLDVSFAVLISANLYHIYGGVTTLEPGQTLRETIAHGIRQIF